MREVTADNYFKAAIGLWQIADRTDDLDDRAMYERVAQKYFAQGLKRLMAQSRNAPEAAQ